MVKSNRQADRHAEEKCAHEKRVITQQTFHITAKISQATFHANQKLISISWQSISKRIESNWIELNTFFSLCDDRDPFFRFVLVEQIEYELKYPLPNSNRARGMCKRQGNEWSQQKKKQLQQTNYHS